jgi:hypothetical protein
LFLLNSITLTSFLLCCCVVMVAGLGVRESSTLLRDKITCSLLAIFTPLLDYLFSVS